MKIKNALLLLLTAPYGGWPLWRRALEWIMWVLLHLTASDALWAVSSFFPAYGFLTGRIKKRKQVPAIPGARKTLVMGGICCGVALCLASNFQQFGIQYTTVGKAGS